MNKPISLKMAIAACEAAMERAGIPCSIIIVPTGTKQVRLFKMGHEAFVSGMLHRAYNDHFDVDDPPPSPSGD